MTSAVASGCRQYPSITPSPRTTISDRKENQKISVFIECGHVAGVKPTATHDFRRSFRLPPIPFHHPVATNHDFPDGVAVRRHISVVSIDDAHFYSGNRVAGHRLADIT